MSVIERFKAFYTSLKHAELSAIPDIYSVDVTLIDPVGTHTGLPALESYFKKLLKNAKHCDFSISTCAAMKPTDQAESEAYCVVWQMHFAVPSLKKGQTITVDGMTHLKVRDDRIVYHRDFYDLGQMIYDHIPLLGWATNKIKSGMRA
jgi:hypothetical protein